MLLMTSCAGGVIVDATGSAFCTNDEDEDKPEEAASAGCSFSKTVVVGVSLLSGCVGVLSICISLLFSV